MNFRTKGLLVSVVLLTSLQGYAANQFFNLSDSLATTVHVSAPLRVRDMALVTPSGWTLTQRALDHGTTILGFEKNGEYISIFVSGETINMRDVFVNGSEVIRAEHTIGNWTVLNTAMENVYITSFMTVMNGNTYYGYGKTNSMERSDSNVMNFLTGFVPNQNRSLTDESYKGKKYYLGWGAAMPGDASNMQNEVKYDVLHTHDIFTKDVGGNYAGVKYLSYKDATGANIKAEWARLKDVMTADDMYIEYSSGHGSSSGLAVGVNYDQIRDATMAFNAKETIVFIMACHSGGLVNSFNKKKTEWQNMQSTGRTLYVMASSDVNTNSSTGPGKDNDEPGGPSGSAGSAFGHALWKSLIGYADGSVDGVKDGYISLGEIDKFTKKKTQEVGQHMPVSTGAYSPELKMNKVPPKEFLASLEITSEGLSDEEIMQRVRELDSAMRVQ